MSVSADPQPRPAESEAPRPGGEAPYPSSFHAWLVVMVLMLIYVNSFMDRQILSLIVEPIKKDLKVTDKQMGFLMGPAFAIFYTLAGIPLGRAADQFSRRWIIGVGQFFWSLMSAACGLVQTFRSFILLRMGLGVGEATLSPAAYSMITDLFPRGRLGTAMSVYSIGIYLGSGIAVLLGGSVIQYVGAHETITLPLMGEVRSWQSVFLAIAAPAVPLTLILFFIKEPVRRGLAKARPRPSVREVRGYLGDNWATLLCHNLGFGLLALSAYASQSWIPTFLKRVHHWEPGRVGVVYGVQILVFGSAGIVFAGMWADWLAKRGWRNSKMFVGFISSLGWFPAGIWYLLTPNQTLMEWLLVPTLFTTAMSFGVAPAAIQEMAPASMRGQTSAVYLFVINLLGLGLGPQLLPYFTQNVFAKEGDEAVRYALATLPTIAHIGATVLLWLGLKPFTRSMDYLKAFNEREAKREASA